MISPRQKALATLIILVLIAVFLFLLFPAAIAFVEGAARSIVRRWWLVLLIALSCWLIWGAGRKEK